MHSVLKNAHRSGDGLTVFSAHVHPTLRDFKEMQSHKVVRLQTAYI
jgi:hypothetical protein